MLFGIYFLPVPTIYYLRVIRERRRLTQAALAKRSHVAQTTISKLERRPHMRPVFGTVLALARALGIDPVALRFGLDPKRKDRPADARRRRAKPAKAGLEAGAGATV